MRPHSIGVVEDDAHRVPQPRAQATDAVAKVDPVGALYALHRPMMGREGHGVALTKRHDFGTALHPGTLFGQYEFAAREVLAGLGKQTRDLKRKGEVAVEILMQTIEVARNILK